MPYITKNFRQYNVNDHDYPCLAEHVDSLIANIHITFDDEHYEGVCNYVISRVVAGVMKPEDGWRYKWLNRAHGTFLSAAAEFYRRLVVPYEDECIEKNGDIPEYTNREQKENK